MELYIINICRGGECDVCHDDSALYSLEPDEPGDWEYCLHCAERIIRRRQEQAKKAGDPIRLQYEMA